MRCTYLGCTRKPTSRIVPAYGKPWLGCKLHAPAMATALSIGNPDSRQARTEKL